MKRGLATLRRHPWRTLSAAVLVVVAGATALNADVIRAWMAEDLPVDFALPVAPPLDPATGETVYVIDAANSLVTVELDEELAGNPTRVELTTRSIAGEIAVADDGSSVRIGEIVVGVDQLRSDNSLRDKMLHHEFLESHVNPHVRLTDAVVELPESATDTSVEEAGLDGVLQVKDVDHVTSWVVDARLDGDDLIATATTTVLMSDLGVGPITKAGLVSTSNEMDLTLEIVATVGHVPPTGLVDQEITSVAAEDVAAAPSFALDVQPILEANCASCHAPGELGASMWTLAVARNAAEVADGLAVVTGSGYMPPWPASDLGVEVLHPRGLSDEDVATIASWAEAGAPLDVDPMTRIEVPAEAEVPEPRADVVVQMAEAYKGTPELRDDYRCFILDPGITEPTFLTGYDFHPGQLATVHHAIINRVRAPRVEGLHVQDERDDGPGWGCLAGMGFSLGDRIAGWVPGQRPVKMKEGDGFDLQPGDVLVAQIHYHYNAGVPADQSSMTLELTADPDITAIRSETLIGPVELPCTAEMEGPLCDRDAAIVDINERFGPGAQRIANGLHFLCGSTIEEQVANFDGRKGATTCDFPVVSRGTLIGFMAHMHEIGSSYRMTMNPDTSAEKVLLDIPSWNFGWQLGYSPVEEIPIRPGDTLRVTCAWDRGLRHERTPRYIVFAEGTEDEMCYTALTIRPD